MSYTEEQIEKYLEILTNYNNDSTSQAVPPLRAEEEADADAEASRKVRCWNCQSDGRDCFFVNLGYSICDSCGASNGYVLGYYDQKDDDRLHFRKKSVYQRRYHYEKKINQVSKRLQLTEEQKWGLYNKLMAMDNHVTEILNKQFCRKRMISIFYLIKNFLEEMRGESSKASKLVYLKISPQTLESYEKWWDSYKLLLCERTSK